MRVFLRRFSHRVRSVESDLRTAVSYWSVHCGSVGNARDARNNAENKKQHTLRPEIVILINGQQYG